MATKKPDFCAGCPITDLTEGYVPLDDAHDAQDLAVGEAAGQEEAQRGKPFIGGAGTWLTSLFKSAGLRRDRHAIVNVIGCRPPNNTFPGGQDWRYTDHATAREAVAYCRKHHLEPALRAKPWRKILAFGNEALTALTFRRGIFTWRGSPLALRANGSDSPPKVIPTLHPAYLMRDAKWFHTARNDIKRPLDLPAERYNLFPTLEDLAAWDHKEFAFDLEWNVKTEEITLCGMAAGDRSSGTTIVVPWRAEFLDELRRIFENATDLIGWNIVGADLKYFDKLGWNIKARLHDTMLKQHLVQPDMPHSLAYSASFWSHWVFWKAQGKEKEDEFSGEIFGGDQWRTWDSPEAIPRIYGGYGGCASADEAYRLYNARDNAASWEIEQPVRAKLTQYGMGPVYWNVSLPAAHICRRLNETGWRIDPSRVSQVRTELDKDINELEQSLPEGLRPYYVDAFRHDLLPPGVYKEKIKKCKGKKKDGTAHKECLVKFDAPGTQDCPQCGTPIPSGKMQEMKIKRVPIKKKMVPWRSPQKLQDYAKHIGLKLKHNRKTGNASADKKTRKGWGRRHPEFAIVDDLWQRSTIAQSFARESMLYIDRVYFKLDPKGTAEGRFSASGQRKGIDPNIQNQPSIIRQIYVPEKPGHGLLQLDWKSGENWLTAWLAQDHERMEKLRQPGYDEHAELAAVVFDKTLAQVSKGGEYYTLRTVAKRVNHGMNYGMGPYKLLETLEGEGFFSYSVSDCKEFIATWRELNKRTAQWQAETVALASSQSYLENPFGRKRWFSTRDFRTKALAFLPASTLADMKIRCLIALHASEFQKELDALEVWQRCDLPEDWTVKVEVHDSFVLDGPHETHVSCAQLVKRVMEQPWPELDGFHLDTDVEYGTDNWRDLERIKV